MATTEEQLITLNSSVAALVAAVNISRGYLDTAVETSEDAADTATTKAAQSSADRLQVGIDRATVETALALILELASDAVSQGNVPIYSSRSSLAALPVPSQITAVRVNGYASAGDGGKALYKRVTSAPTYGGVRSTDRFLPNGTTDNTNGGWWQIAELCPVVEMFGAKGDGVTDDSAAFVEALAYAQRVEGTKGKIYLVKDITLTSRIFDGNGAVLDVAAGAKYGIRVAGYEPQLLNLTMRDSNSNALKSTTLSAGVAAAATSFTVASATALEVGMLATVLMDNGRWHCSIITAIVGTTVTVARAFEAAATSGAAVDCSWSMINVRGATRALLENIKLLNASFGILSDAPTGLSYINNRCRFKNISIEGALVGMVSGRDCADSRYEDIIIRGGKTQTDNFVGDGATAAFTTTKASWRKAHVTVTVGGVFQTQGVHYNVTSPTQITFTGGNIPAASAAIVINTFYEGKSGLLIDATGFSTIRGGDFYKVLESLGFLRGIEIHAKELTSFDQIISDTISGEALLIDACTSIAGIMAFTDLFLGYAHQCLKVTGNSINIQIDGPFWTKRATSSELSGGAVAASAIDVESGSTIYINAAGWAASADKVTSGAGNIFYPGCMTLQFASITSFAAGTTAYFGPGGAATTELSLAPVARPMRVKRFVALNGSAPGSGQSYTFTLRINGVDSAATGSVSNTGVFSLDLKNLDLPVTSLQSLSVKLVTSAGAQTSAFRFVIELV